MATLELVKEAILALNDRTGSSVYAINQWIESNKKVEVKKHVMRAALKRGVETGQLVKVRASYKLSPEAKKDEKKKKPKRTKNDRVPNTRLPKKKKVSVKARGMTTKKKKASTKRKKSDGPPKAKPKKKVPSKKKAATTKKKKASSKK